MKMICEKDKRNNILSEKGLGTVEIVIITAILVGLALLFREQITKYINLLFDEIFRNGSSIFE